MQNFQRILDNNRRWAAEATKADPDFFTRHEDGQTPHTLFITCSDSRITHDLLTGTKPGEMFVHRNIANQVVAADLNVASVVEFAVEHLDVKHVIVCGHYGCGGIKAALGDAHLGIIDHWLAQVRAVKRVHHDELEALPDDQARVDRLVELNVLEQVHNLTLHPCIRQAWERGKRPLLHGLVYGLHDGLLRELVTEVDSTATARRKLPDYPGA